MTMYRLKDKERQAALEYALPDFLNELNNECCKQINDRSPLVVVSRDTGQDGMWALAIRKDEIESTPEYDKNAWNKYPEVEPPDGVLMRVETRDDKKKCAYFHNFSDGGYWCDPDGTAWPQAFSDSVICYRPWED